MNTFAVEHVKQKCKSNKLSQRNCLVWKSQSLLWVIEETLIGNESSIIIYSNHSNNPIT